MPEVHDDFDIKSDVWSYRTENFSSIEITDGNLKM
jgi:hypothetical protein